MCGYVWIRLATITHRLSQCSEVDELWKKKENRRESITNICLPFRLSNSHILYWSHHGTMWLGLSSRAFELLAECLRKYEIPLKSTHVCSRLSVSVLFSWYFCLHEKQKKKIWEKEMLLASERKIACAERHEHTSWMHTAHCLTIRSRLSRKFKSVFLNSLEVFGCVLTFSSTRW